MMPQNLIDAMEQGLDDCRRQLVDPIYNLYAAHKAKNYSATTATNEQIAASYTLATLSMVYKNVTGRDLGVIVQQ